MAVGEFVTYARDFFRLDYPAEWSVRENRLVGLTDLCSPDEGAGSYPAGIALITIPETGMSLELLLRTGLFFLTRDLDTPTVDRLGEHHEGHVSWHRLVVRGRAPVTPGGTPSLNVTKHIAVCRPGPGVLALALYGPTETIELLEPAFEELRRSVQIVR